MAIVKQQMTVTINDGVITDISLAAPPSLTPVQGTNVALATGGTAVQAIPAGVNGGYIQNPNTPNDQGIAGVEPLYVDTVGLCPVTTAGGTIVALWPGDRIDIPPGSTLGVWVNALTSGHRFTAVYW